MHFAQTVCNVMFIFNKRQNQLLTDVHILWKYAMELTIVDKGRVHWEKQRGWVMEKKMKTDDK